jgi:hypothetical protein
LSSPPADRALAALAGVAVAAALAGCAGGARRLSRTALTARTGVLERTTAAGSTGRGPATDGWLRGAGGHGAYRWLVPVHGPPPGVAQENRARGTRAWRLDGPAELLGGQARGAVEGYVAEQSIAPGAVQTVYVNAPRARSVRVRLYRMGWYGGSGGRLVLESAPLPGGRQPGCTHSTETGLTQCRWHPTLSFRVPAALPSGVYIVKLLASGGAERDCIFVLRAAQPAPLLVEIPTASWEAYNDWGGDSLYPGGEPVRATGTTQGVAVSYDRPYDSQTGAGQFFIREVALVRFLERYGYPVSYTTIDSLDRAPRQALRARAVLDGGHSEYWSARAADALVRARDAGVSLVFLSSDTMAWRVRFERAGPQSSQAGEPGHVMIAYKQAVADAPRPARETGLFPAGGAAITGSAYDGCITPRLPGAGPPVYRYYAWHPAPGLEPRWLYAHSGVRAGTAIAGIVGYELDERTAASPPGTRVLGEGAATCMSEREPASTYGTLAQTTLYTARSGALVFAAGTLGWLYGLEAVPQASPDVPRRPDGRVVAMTRNLLQRVLVRRPAGGRAGAAGRGGTGSSAKSSP